MLNKSILQHYKSYSFGKIYISFIPLFLILTLSIKIYPEEELAWAKMVYGDGGSGEAVKVLNDGSSLVVGVFYGENVFGPGEPNQTVFTSYGTYTEGSITHHDADIFIAKYNRYGNLDWVKQAGGTLDDIAYSIDSCADESFLVVGTYCANGVLGDTCKFGFGELSETIISTNGKSDIFIAKYNSLGYFEWVKHAGSSSSSDIAYGVSTLPTGDFIVTGNCFSPITFGQGETNETTIDNNGTFVAKYNINGNLIWVKSIQGLTFSCNPDVKSISDGSCIITGHFMDSIILGAGEPNQTTLTSHGLSDKDLFLAKYGTNGNLIWAKGIGGSGSDIGGSVDILSDNSIIFYGSFTGTVIFGEGEPNQTTFVTSPSYFSDIFIARYNQNGNLIWTKKAGGNENDNYGRMRVSLSDSIFITGTIGGTAIFGSGEPNQTILIPKSDSLPFIAKYNSNGYLYWAKSIYETEVGGSTRLSQENENACIITGSFKGSVIFGSGETNETLLISKYRDPFYLENIFIARYGLLEPILDVSSNIWILYY